MRPVIACLAAIVGAVIAVVLSTVSDPTLMRIGEWLVYGSLPAANGFVLVYGLTRPWYLSQIGRALMTKALGVAALFDLSAFAQMSHVTIPLRLTVIVVGLIVAGIWYQFLVMLRTPRDKRPRG